MYDNMNNHYELIKFIVDYLALHFVSPSIKILKDIEVILLFLFN